MGLELLGQIIAGYKVVLFVILVGYLIHWIPEVVKERYRTWFATRNLVTMGALTILAVFFIYQFMSGEMQPFIYFQF